MCHECAQELRKQTSKCPICRNQVESLLHIKVGDSGARLAAVTGDAEVPVAEQRLNSQRQRHWGLARGLPCCRGVSFAMHFRQQLLLLTPH